MINFCILLGERIQACYDSFALGIPNGEDKGFRIVGARRRPDKGTFPTETGPDFRNSGRFLSLSPGRNVPDDTTGLRGRQEKRTSIQETQAVDDFSPPATLFCTALLIAGRSKAGM